MPMVAEFERRFRVDKGVADKLSFNPYYKKMDESIASPRIDTEPYIDLASNNYLGLATDERVKNAVVEALHRYGASMCGTPIATGYAGVVHALERRMCEFAGVEEGIVFPSCYQGNVAILSALIDKSDTVFIDHYAHASLIHGAKSSGCRIRPFLHNDVDHLQKLLNQHGRQGPTFVITESVFSTEGSIAPFEAIASICKRYDALLVVDDSHGIGVIGGTGRGILEQSNVRGFQGIYTASLGKALGNAGGFVGGTAKVIDFIRYTCPGLIYSTALPPAVAAGALEALNVVETEYKDRARRMWGHKKRLSDCLTKCGYDHAQGGAPIVSVSAGSAETTIALSKALFESRILSTPFIPPSVPPNRGCVRMIAGAHLAEKGLAHVCRTLETFAGIPGNKAVPQGRSW